MGVNRGLFYFTFPYNSLTIKKYKMTGNALTLIISIFIGFPELHVCSRLLVFSMNGSARVLVGLHPPSDPPRVAGRAGNAWLSPLGCAMFTVHTRVPVGSRLGQSIPFLQHLAALAVVEAVRTLRGYEVLYPP